MLTNTAMTCNNSVLIVEDDAYLSKVLVGRLKEEGFKVRCADDGLQALTMCKAEKFDLILLDLLMPVMGGLSFLRKLKKESYRQPIIVLTNLAQDDELKEARTLGAENCFIKSNISLDEVVDKVKGRLAKVR